MNADKVVKFVNESTREEQAFLLTILSKYMFVAVNRNGHMHCEDVESCCLNGTALQLNLISDEID